MRLTWAAAVPAALAVLLLASAGSAQARAQHPNCNPRGAAFASDVRARLFQTDLDDGDYVVHACDLLTGRLTEVVKGYMRQSDGFYHVRFAGRRIAFAHRSCFAGATDNLCGTTIRSIDVQRRTGFSAYPDGTVLALAVAPSGAVAWIESTDEGLVRVKTATAEGRGTELDASPGIDPASLALARDRHLYWADRGTERSAVLDTAAAPREPRDPPVGGARRCHPPGSITYGASTRARVYGVSDRSSGLFQLVVCNLRTGRDIVVTELDEPQPLRVTAVRFAGWSVAVGWRECVQTQCASPALEIADARSGTLVSRTSDGLDSETIDDLVLTKRGATAYTVGRRVRRCGTDGVCETLGRHGGATSLALDRRGRVFWTGADGAPLSAPLQ